MIEALLNELELALKESELWSEVAPSKHAFASQAPFCYDTMRFEQWLQYVFIFKLKMLIANNAPLPKGALVTPMAEQMLPQHRQVIAVLTKLDKALSE